MENEFSDAFVFENKVGIHTFELFRDLTNEEWEHLADKRAEISSEPLWKFALLCPGLRFRLLDRPRRMVTVIVDPRLLRDTAEDEYAYYGITKFGDHYFKTALKNFDALWFDMIGCTFNDFRLSRVDLCYNVVFPNGNGETVRKYISLLRHTPWKGRFILEDLPDAEQQPYCFKISNRTRSLVVYDKIFQQAHCYSAQMPPCPAMMRVELQLGRRAIDEEDDFPTTKKLLRHFLRQAPEIMVEQISKVICPQPYVTRAEMEKQITESDFLSGRAQRLRQFSQILEQSTDAAAGLQQMERVLKQNGRNACKGIEHLKNAYYLLRIAPVPQELTPFGLYSLPQITAMACLGQKRMPAIS